MRFQGRALHFHRWRVALTTLSLGCFAATPLLAQTYTTSVSSRGGFSDVVVPAGDYSIKITAGPWNAWNGRTGIDPTTGELLGWLHSYSGLTSGGAPFGTGSARYQSPGAAMAAAPVLNFSLAQAETLRFRIDDPVPEDNVGGLSFSITKIPCNPLAGATYERIEKGYTAVQPFLDPGALAGISQAYSESGDFASFVRQLGAATEQGLGSAFSRVLGVIQSLGIGLLNPEVANGVKQIYDSITDPRKDVCGLTNVNERNILNDVFRQMDQDFAPHQPISTEGGKSKFDIPVKGGKIEVCDPPIGEAITYEAGPTDPDFASVVLPTLGLKQGKFRVQVPIGEGWGDFVSTDPLREVLLPPGTRRFRIAGINTAAVPPKTHWIAGISFVKDGRFTGSISSIGSTYEFSSFLPPTNIQPTVNSGVAGQTFPLKWTLSSGGDRVSSLNAIQSISFRPAQCSTFTPTGDRILAAGSGGTSLRYDATAAQYVFNWKSPSNVGCYVLALELSDGQVFTANYMLR